MVETKRRDAEDAERRKEKQLRFNNENPAFSASLRFDLAVFISLNLLALAGEQEEFWIQS
jgi:hypothetical protein